MRIGRIEDRLDGVQRARADVPEDHSESTNRESALSGSAPVHPSIRLPAPKPQRITLANDPSEPGYHRGAGSQAGIAAGKCGQAHRTSESDLVRAAGG
jgi:hypothetical protein